MSLKLIIYEINMKMNCNFQYYDNTSNAKKLGLHSPVLRYNILKGREINKIQCFKAIKEAYPKLSKLIFQVIFRKEVIVEPTTENIRTRLSAVFKRTLNI